MAIWKSPLVAIWKSPPLAGSSVGGWGVTSFLAGVAHPVGLAVGDHDGGVVQEAVQDADGGGVFG